MHQSAVLPKSSCPHHEAIQKMADVGERDRAELWTAMHEVRTDIKGLIGKIGLIVGTITAINSVVLIVVQYAFAHAK